MQISLDHDKLKADLDGSAAALGVKVECHESETPSMTGRVQHERKLVVVLPRPTNVYVRFVREGFLERAKKLFVEEVEVGSAVFDDLIYVVTSTRDATAALLANERVQQALLLLVNDSRHVAIEGAEVRVIDSDVHDDSRDSTAEALALAAHLIAP